jgi:hypothetical protein
VLLISAEAGAVVKHLKNLPGADPVFVHLTLVDLIE